MDSRELGLALAQQLLGVQDLHYGLWNGELELRLENLCAAQQSYSDFVIDALPKVPGQTVLDVGCGTGHLLAQLHCRGFLVDGVSPAPSLTRLARERLASIGAGERRIFECRFQEFPAHEHERAYDAVVFSESLQYIPLDRAVPLLERILRRGGRLVICDFFKTAAHGDGGPGDRTFGGGHPLSAFYRQMADSRFENLRDEDITPWIVPNLALLDEVLMKRLKPAGETLDVYLSGRRPWLWRGLLWVFRKPLAKMKVKYFSGHRCPEVFARYKTYRLLEYPAERGLTSPEQCCEVEAVRRWSDKRA